MVTNMKKIKPKIVVVPGLVTLIFVSFAAWGQALTDPTRPAGSIESGAGVGAVAAYQQPRGLQSVLLFTGHCAAIIDGKTVLLGARHGAEMLVEVSEHGVTLQGEHGRRELSLFPTVGIKMSSVIPTQKNAIKCHFEPGNKIVNPEKQSAHKERK